jgi:hypothetical protein
VTRYAFQAVKYKACGLFESADRYLDFYQEFYDAIKKQWYIEHTITIGV